MGKKYSGIADSVAVGSDKTIITLISATTIRPALYEMFIGSGATPADNATIFHLERFTAVGTEGSGFTPFAIGPDPASAADYGVGAFSVEPTYTASAILLTLAMNLRNTIRWVCAGPGYEFVAPATANNGIGLQAQSSGGTAGHSATMYHEE